MKRWYSILTLMICLVFGACAQAPASSPTTTATDTTAPTSSTTTAVLPTTPSATEPTTSPTTSPNDPATPPSAEKRAFVKAVWVPFMEVNGLLASGNTAHCEQNIVEMLDDCVARGANTVYFHVRANSDAYYASTVFSPHKTAKPLIENGFDPLAFAVEKAHERGLALHAWVNPYRIGTDASFAKTAEIFEYGGKWYYDPTVPDNQQLIVSGIKELVERYAIDGVQFDDYFYPKGAVPTNEPAAFEQVRYMTYKENVGEITVGDWRREQVSRLMEQVYATCHHRENCVFGISPGYDIDDNHDNLYADIERWAAGDGYVDYLCPQLYFGYRHQHAPFTRLMDNWEALDRASGVKLYAGLGLYKTGLLSDTYAGSGKDEWAAGGDIIARQLQDVYTSKWDGAALYSHLSFETDSTRDATVAAAECEAACAKWKTF